jgi:Amt family ammonium transporter
MLLTAPSFSGSTTILAILSISLVPLAIAGLALINTGLGRSRSAAHTMVGTFCALAVAMMVYCVWGFALQGTAGGQAHVIHMGAKAWNWLAIEPWFFRGVIFDGSAKSLIVWLQMLSVGMAVVIPLGASAERCRLGATCFSTVVLAGCTYPIFAHWALGGGWLAQLGVNYGLGQGFLDAGGSGTIHAVGGLTALSLAWIVGPRHGKYSPEGLPMAIPGHNAVVVVLGCLLALLGWIGLNGAGALLLTGVPAGRFVLVAVNTTLTAAAAGLASAAITRLRFGKMDCSLAANGLVGGLVSISAACATVTPPAAIMIGLVAGALVTFSVEMLELRLSIDDPGGAISVHATGGLWGLLAAGILAPLVSPASTMRDPGAAIVNTGYAGQWLAQCVGIATLLGFVLPLGYGLNQLVNRFYKYRVTAEGEAHGIDLHELGAGAYPDFVTHPDDFLQR